ncbi:hypothetical protein D9613_000199 [Agrocybe pediades]|uniref:Gluconokinase n=1 Tax=Agrocybe pediades TaxID=84607 RepID=A0A8H4R396_9AGAR|nr:hypothetical protein D9613_000199 [Agrocybe pediades]
MEQSTPAMDNHAVFIVVMGVSGTGKSTLGNALAKALDMPYVEGDDLHPKSNVEKMSSGIPLNDADREPWLELVRTTAEHKIVEQQTDARTKENKCHGVVITCSSLKKYYREILRGEGKPAGKDKVPDHLEPAEPHIFPTYFVFIQGSRETLLDRMEKRPGHFMKAGMLDSQLNTLESPVGEGGVVVVSTEDPTEKQIESAEDQLVKIAGPYFKEHIVKRRGERGQ